MATVSFLAEAAKNVALSEGTKIITYENQQDCIDAVTNGEVDAVLCNGYFAEYLMRTELKYGNLQIESVLSGEYSISIALRNNQTTLSDILEKLDSVDNKRQYIISLIRADISKEKTRE